MKNGLPSFDSIENCQKFFNEKNLNEYRDKEKNDNLRVLNFNDEENFFYFGETFSAEKPDLINGFGFISNVTENEFYLGNFEEDNFLRGIWQKNPQEIFIGNFKYLNKEDKNLKTNFDGVMFNKTENFSKFLCGDFDFQNSDFKGFSMQFDIEQKENSQDSRNLIIFDDGEFKNNKRNCPELLTVLISEDKNKSISFKYILANYVDDKITNDYYLLDSSSIIRMNGNNENNNLTYYSEVIENNGTLFRGEFKNENQNEIQPIFQGPGIIIDTNENLRYKGNFENGKKSGPNETLLVLNIPANNGNISIKKFEGEFQNDNFVKGSVMENGNKFIQDAIFEEKDFSIKHGTIFHEKNEQYTGDFVNNKRHGEGVYRYEDKKEYHGQWKEGNRHGSGTLFMEDRNKRIEGEWENNKLKKIKDTNMELKDIEQPVEKNDAAGNNNNSINSGKDIENNRPLPEKENKQEIIIPAAPAENNNKEEKKEEVKEVNEIKEVKEVKEVKEEKSELSNSNNSNNAENQQNEAGPAERKGSNLSNNASNNNSNVSSNSSKKRNKRKNK